MNHIRILLLFLLFLLPACSTIDKLTGQKKEKTPLPGERVSILELQKQLEPDDDALNAQGFISPSVWNNDFWPQGGGYPNHSLQNLAFTTEQPNKVWSADIGEGSRKSLPLTAQPVIADKKIFTLDTESRLSAFSIEKGTPLWHTNIRKKNEGDPVIGGGLSFSGGVLYATSGYGELLAANPDNGEIYWRAKLSAPSRAAPTIMDGRVFVSSLNNNVIAFDAKDGQLIWEYEGIGGNTSLLGSAACAADREVAIAGFSSGALYALRVENGSTAWSDNLSGVSRAGGLSSLSDIRGLPVIDKNLVIAISFGGKIVAIDKRTGQRVWQRDIAGTQTPWLAGNYVFVLASDNEMVALGRETGAIQWVSRLARYKNKEERTGPISWTGPLLAGGRLMAFSDDGRAVEINPKDGSLLREWHTGHAIRIAPALAGGTLYLLAEDGSLLAFR